MVMLVCLGILLSRHRVSIRAVTLRIEAIELGGAPGNTAGRVPFEEMAPLEVGYAVLHEKKRPRLYSIGPHTRSPPRAQQKRLAAAAHAAAPAAPPPAPRPVA